MIKTINLKTPTSLLAGYKMKRNLEKERELRLQKSYEDYIYKGIMEAKEKRRKGAKIYSEKEFVELMGSEYGIYL